MNFVKVIVDGREEWRIPDYDEVTKEIEANQALTPPKNYLELSEEEINNDIKMRYKLHRSLEYPNINEFADAWVKQDEVALEAYREACLAVKAKYPKPE